ncbi:MAG: DUF1540 domain-containing protein [Candidatus Limivicinus sp.]
MIEKKRCLDNPGVVCDVTNCKYNTIDCKCNAAKITVQNEKACTKGETYCSTFSPRGTASD